MPEHFDDWSNYVGREFESRRDGSSARLSLLELGLEEFWVEDNDGARWSIKLEDLDRWWKPHVPMPKVGELWNRKSPYLGRCEVLAVADNYVVFTFDPTGSKADPATARTLDNFMRTYEPPEK